MTHLATLESDRALPDFWYVVYSKPRQEALALQNLLNQSYKVWLPQLTSWAKRRGHWQAQVCPMFPRYLLLQPAHAQQGIGPVRSTYGVSGLVQFGGTPANMSRDIVQALRDLESALREQPNSDSASPFSPGMSVRIASGPLCGLEGIVTKAARDRVTVLLSLLGRQKEVALSPEMVELE